MATPAAVLSLLVQTEGATAAAKQLTALDSAAKRSAMALEGAAKSTNTLAMASTRLRAATLSVEKAQLSYEAAVKKSGSGSLAARQALVGLQLAQERASASAGRLAAAESKAAASTTAAGNAAAVSAKKFSLAAASAKRTEQSVDSLGRSVGRVARYGGVAGAFGLAKFVKDGIAFNATMEQNRIAFTQFLGSARAANREIKILYDIAKTTPFEFKDVTLAARKFSAFGFEINTANKMLRTLADAASGLALDNSGIDRMVLAIGQIKSKGTLMAQDLRQLQELGAIDLSQLAKDLGLTAAQVADIGKQGVPATAALQAIERQWQRTFGGQSMKQAKTFTGLLSTFKDNYRQFAGSLVTTPFDFSKTLMGKLNNSLTEINDEFRKHPSLTLQAKIEIAKDKLKPVTDDIAQVVKDAHIEQHIIDAMDKAIPVIAEHGAKLGLAAVKGFAKAFVNGDALTKLALGAFFLSKFVGWGNIFKKLGSTAGKRFAAQFAASSAAGIAAEVAAEGAIGSAVAGGAALSRWGKLGKLAGRAAGGAIALAIALEINKQLGDKRSPLAQVINPLGGIVGLGMGGKANIQGAGAPPPGYTWNLSTGKLEKIGRGGYGNPPTVPGSAFGLGKSQRANAATIIAVGRQMGASRKQIVAALEAGIVESNLRNLSYGDGDRDSVGVFQQRPSQGWTGLRNLPKAAREFFQHAMRADRSPLSAGGLAQAVQRSAYPGRYAGAQGRALDLLRSLGGSGDTGPIKYKRVGATGKDNSAVETAALQNAISWLRQYHPEIGYLLEDKGGKNQHLHINSANHKAIREIARQLNAMGFNVGEYGGKPIPGIGGITTLKHKHYGAADHYHGGALDVNADQLIRIFGTGSPLDAPGANVFKAPKITQKQFLDFMQSRIAHFDLMVRAGLLSATNAALKKRAAIKGTLPNLTGDTRLEALAMLRELKIPTPAQKTWTAENKQRLAMAIIQANPGNVANLPSGVIKAAGAYATMQNPWLQAFQQNLTNQVGAGVLTQAQSDEALKKVFERTLPFLTGQDAADVRTTLHTIAQNTADAATAALQTANAIAASGISDAQFFGGLTGPAKDAVSAILGGEGIVDVPGLNIPFALGNPGASAELARNDIRNLMAEVRAGQISFADVWPQIREDLNVITTNAGETGEAVSAATDALKALTDEIAKDRASRDEIVRSNWNTAVKALADVLSGQIAGPMGYQGRAATAGAGSTYRL